MATLRALENEQPAAAPRGSDGASAAARVPLVVDALAKLTVSTGANPAVPPTFQFVPESLEQICRLQGLQERVAELEEALKREQDRSKLLQLDLTRMRLQHAWSLGGSGSSGASSPGRLGSLDSAAASAFAAAQAQLPPGEGSEAAAGEAPWAAAGGGAADPPAALGGPAAAAETVVISRAALELLYLKERAMDSAKEGIVIADCSLPDMPLIYANEGFSRMTGYDRSDVLGRNCRFLQQPPHGATGPDDDANVAAVEEIRSAITSGMPCVVQLMNYKRSGDPFVNYLSLNPVYDDSGKLTHYVGVQSDITELVNHRKAELQAKHAALQAAAATEAKSQFLARMSHEIRTPLNGMIAVGQLLADTPLSPAQWDLVNTIRCSGETLLTLITDILDFSRIEANKMVLSNSDFRLQTVIEAAMEIAGLHAAQKRLQVAYHVAETVPAIVVGDAQRLQQILLNILNNAVKFTEAGEILLEVWAEEVEEGGASQAQQAQQAQQPAGDAEPAQAAQAASALPQAGSPRPQRSLLLQFSVRDTGIGISTENIGRLFQSFSQVDASPTRRHGGSGLGLAICQRLCQAMGGRMWAESGGTGEGSLFRWCIRVRLPDSGMGGPRGSGSLTLTPPSSGRCSLEASSARSSLDNGLRVMGAPPAGPASVASTAAYALTGRSVLLVEPCPMVRHVMALALRRWGCAVCAVGSEAEGIARLKPLGAPGSHGGRAAAAAAAALAATAPGAPGSLPPPASPGSPPRPAPAAQQQQRERQQGARPLQPRPDMQLEHAEPLADADFQASGPFDVVIMDMQHQHMLQALMSFAHPSEAQRVVFMGWPGQNEPEEHADSSLYGGGDSGSLCGSAGEAGASQPAGGLPPLAQPAGQPLAAQPPRQLAEQLSAARRAPGQRQLGYVVVTRPLRQGRLRLALEEVLHMAMDPAPAESDGSQASGPRPAGAPAPAPGAPGLDPYSPAALLGLGSDSDTADISSVGSRASSSSNLRCASTLMRTTASYGHLADVAAGAAGGAAPMRLLLAEDNAINMKVALGILKRMGCTNIVTAEDGEAALEALHAAGGPDAFDVILMDLHMPKKGGMEAVRDIRRTWSRYKTKIIAVTADAFEDTRDQCIANGFDGWLAKPFRVEEFARVLAACRSGAALTPKRPS